MRFLVDNQLPVVLCRWLIQQGHEARHVLELALAKSDDRTVGQHAARTDAVLATKDADFINLAPLQSGPQIVWVRLGNCRNDALVQAFARVLPRLLGELEAGCRVVELR